MKDLHIPLKSEYFDQIVAGVKPWEFRLVTDYWCKRLYGREYRNVVLTKGYPKRDDAARRHLVPWRGWEFQTITHPHFGPEPVVVFAIRVAP